jgi:APA family basic amino acid/polyamine antiporter
LGEFAAGLFPLFDGHAQLVGVSGLILVTLLNWIGLRPGSRAQEFTSAAKALGLIGLVIACFVHPAASGASLVTKFSIHEQGLFLGLILALQGVVVTYDGWYAPPFICW